jgi:UDP-N-acetylglucosamine--N-acetylmuramyl-(pentapeptide) pyrophosphoryl-undecaprenol N-acetylglucosamine transferase
MTALRADVNDMRKEWLRVVIAGGGTGGHLYPGIAIARELQARRSDVQITFAGTARGIEGRVVPREGFALDLIRSSGLKGKSLGQRLRGAATIPVSLVDAWRIVSARRPRLVIGVGGYSSGPVVLVAALRGVPTMLLEQNAVPGFTNRVLARFVRAAAVSFDATLPYFGTRGFVSGNPVRPEFASEASGRQHDDPDDAGGRTVGVSVLVFGGSQGAHAINVAMAEAAPDLAQAEPPLRLTHQTGEKDLEMVRGAYRSAGLAAEVEPFLFDMGRRMSDADLIVSRAGATTIAEIAAAGKPAILIPLPAATDDHQRKNAEVLAASGGAELLLQNEASGRALALRIRTLAGDSALRARMSAAVRLQARPDAARTIVDRALALADAG